MQEAQSQPGAGDQHPLVVPAGEQLQTGDGARIHRQVGQQAAAARRHVGRTGGSAEAGATEDAHPAAGDRLGPQPDVAVQPVLPGRESFPHGTNAL